MTARWVLGVDSGGSGLRTALAPAATETSAASSAAGAPGVPEAVGRTVSAEPVRTGAAGIDATHLLEQLLPAARSLLAEAGGGRVDTVCVGAAGMATLGAGLRATLPAALAEALGVRRLALAADAVTAYAGALGEEPGAVVAAGTGMIALGTDLRGWRRADGWGHLLGDRGGGAWIGQAGLDAALRAFDGRAGGSAALRERAELLFDCRVDGLPALLYPRTDRPAVLASFAPEVLRCASGVDGGGVDPVAAGIVRRAAEEIAATAAAVCPPAEDAHPDRRTTEPTAYDATTDGAGAEDTGPDGAGAVSDAHPRVALTGGLFRSGTALLEPVREQLAVRLPHARAVTAAGDPLDGALLVATRLSVDALRLPTGSPLLTVS
ncbi:N-acetylglucosamine kinase [Streptomyces phytohabitans]|uniref:N-acetylglucosamine kinase n=1 Tax=Streptomyces phytohabitans TaxID=1150371 RepID=UPI00345C58CF